MFILDKLILVFAQIAEKLYCIQQKRLYKKGENKDGNIVKANMIDKAIFWHLGKQIYRCELFQNGISKGTKPNDIRGIFLHGAIEVLRKKHPNIVIEVKDVE